MQVITLLDGCSLLWVLYADTLYWVQLDPAKILLAENVKTPLLQRRRSQRAAQLPHLHFAHFDIVRALEGEERHAMLQDMLPADAPFRRDVSAEATFAARYCGHELQATQYTMVGTFYTDPQVVLWRCTCRLPALACVASLGSPDPRA